MKVICISGKAQHGKDTTAGFMKEALEKKGFARVLVAHYGDLVKYVAKTFFDWDGKRDEKGRSILQEVGTDRIRNADNDYWVRFIADMLGFFDGKWDYVLIPDCRFPNEIEFLKNDQFDVLHFRIIRSDFVSPLTEEQQKHPSETALDNYIPDYVITNSGDLDDLKTHIETVVDIMSRRGVL